MKHPVPASDRYFEHYVPGETYGSGEIDVEEGEVLAFARRFDPQSFHVDAEAARQSEYGGLIASGWHTAALMMRLYTQDYLSTVSTLVSPGIDEIRWRKPVRPGDRLSLQVTVLTARVSQSRPDRGIVQSSVEVRNQHGETVMTLTALNFFLRRPADG